MLAKLSMVTSSGGTEVASSFLDICHQPHDPQGVHQATEQQILVIRYTATRQQLNDYEITEVYLSLTLFLPRWVLRLPCCLSGSGRLLPVLVRGKSSRIVMCSGTP